MSGRPVIGRRCPGLGCWSGDAKYLTVVLNGQPGLRVGTPHGSAAADRVRRIRRIQPIPFRWLVTGFRPVSMSGGEAMEGRVAETDVREDSDPSLARRWDGQEPLGGPARPSARQRTHCRRFRLSRGDGVLVDRPLRRGRHLGRPVGRRDGDPEVLHQPLRLGFTVGPAQREPDLLPQPRRDRTFRVRPISTSTRRSTWLP